MKVLSFILLSFLLCQARAMEPAQFVESYLEELSRSFEVEDNRQQQYEILSRYLSPQWSSETVMQSVFSSDDGDFSQVNAEDSALTQAVLQENVRQKMAGVLSFARKTQVERLNSGFAVLYGQLNQDFSELREKLLSDPLSFAVKDSRQFSENSQIVKVELAPELELDIFFHVVVWQSPRSGRLYISDYRSDGISVYQLMMDELTGYTIYHYRRSSSEPSAVAWFHRSEKVQDALERWGFSL